MQDWPELHWIEGRASNIYLWEVPEGLIMVDSGMPGDVQAIETYLHAHNFEFTTIKAIFITHADYDHAGTAAAVQKRSGAAVFAGEETAALLSRGKSPKHMFFLAYYLLNTFMRYGAVDESAIRVVRSGERIPGFEDWQILASPGHTADHHAYYNGTHGVLFPGDALNNRGDVLKRSPDRISLDRLAASRSAISLLHLEPALFACGHGRPKTPAEAGELAALYQQLKDDITRWV